VSGSPVLLRTKSCRDWNALGSGGLSSGSTAAQAAELPISLLP
jgi:hypothetical protein